MASPLETAEQAALTDLVALVDRLRGDNGCPWDRRQTAAGMARYLTEEAFELADAVGGDDPAAVCEELGDVLFQVVFIARLFAEKGRFGLADVIRGTIAKMVRRHPHVFGDAPADSVAQIRQTWHAIKQREKPQRAGDSVLDSVPGGLPALMRAHRISERAARTGFDWAALSEVMDKVEEEWAEFKAELSQTGAGSDGAERRALEFGDLLFTLVNVARFAGLHADGALSAATRKFEGRFRRMERTVAARGRRIDTLTREEFDAAWEAAKALEDMA